MISFYSRSGVIDTLRLRFAWWLLSLVESNQLIRCVDDGHRSITRWTVLDGRLDRMGSDESCSGEYICIHVLYCTVHTYSVVGFKSFQSYLHAWCHQLCVMIRIQDRWADGDELGRISIVIHSTLWYDPHSNLIAVSLTTLVFSGGCDCFSLLLVLTVLLRQLTHSVVSFDRTASKVDLDWSVLVRIFNPEFNSHRVPLVISVSYSLGELQFEPVLFIMILVGCEWVDNWQTACSSLFFSCCCCCFCFRLAGCRIRVNPCDSWDYC